MAKAKSRFAPVYEGLQAWQRHRNLKDADMADKIGCCQSTWSAYKLGKAEIGHEHLVRALNILDVPRKDAAEILTAGLMTE